MEEMEREQEESMTRVWHSLTRRMEKRLAQGASSARRANAAASARGRPKQVSRRSSGRARGR
jgi:hypothetical protein